MVMQMGAGEAYHLLGDGECNYEGQTGSKWQKIFDILIIAFLLLQFSSLMVS